MQTTFDYIESYVRRRSRRLSRLARYAIAVAACILLFILGYFFNRPTGPRQLAAAYIRQHYDKLSQTMDGSRDSLQQGIAAYNRGDFPAALAIFSALALSHPDNMEAHTYTGVVYLRQRNFDQALAQFDNLAKAPGLFSNPGPFLEAITLLQRDAPGDKAAATGLLEEVVRLQSDGWREAADWL